MKVLFGPDVLDEVVFAGRNQRDVSVLLNLCQEKKILGYACNYYFLSLIEKMDREDVRNTLTILSNLLQLIDVSRFEIQNALKQEDFEMGLYQLTAKRHRLDCIVTMKKNEDIRSKIKVYDPMQLRRELENGKTA